MLRLGRGNVGVQSLVEQRALFGIDLNKVSMKPAAAHCSLFLPNFRRRSWAISNESFAVGADMGEKHPSIPPGWLSSRYRGESSALFGSLR